MIGQRMRRGTHATINTAGTTRRNNRKANRRKYRKATR